MHLNFFPLIRLSKRILIASSLLLISIVTLAQVPVGHRSIIFFDPARNNRQVPAEIYYPAVTAGNNTMVLSGTFPVLVFGHGFLMSYSAYAYLRTALVPEGYIMVFPTTEGSIVPNHLNLGLDLAFLVQAMKNEGADPASPFYQHVDSTSAVMGHSMGGGASFLGCKNNTLPTVMVTLAAAETNPSAISAATGVTIPSLVFAASGDCVTPPATNQVPMYDSLGSTCKVYINISGGGHCYFADYNFQCSLGETGCQQNITITREEQQDVVLDFVQPYLDYYLKKNAASWAVFNDSLNASPRISQMISCSFTGTGENLLHPGYRLFPNPAGDFVILQSDSPAKKDVIIRLCDPAGRTVQTGRIQGPDLQYAMNVSAFSPGMWIVSVQEGERVSYLKFIRK